MKKILFVTACLLLSANAHAASAPSLAAPQTTSHGVTLAWDASTTPGVVSYSVWRATRAGGPYGRLISPSPVMTYTDTTVLAGSTYFYVATAMLSGVESDFSNEVSAMVPSATTPPPTTGLPAIGDRIQVKWTANIRATAPISSYGTLYGTEPAGALGTVVGGPVATTLGWYWVQVKFDSCIAAIPNCTGWTGSNNMTIVSVAPPPPTMSTACAWQPDGVTWRCDTLTANLPRGQGIKTVVTSGTLANTVTGTR